MYKALVLALFLGFASLAETQGWFMPEDESYHMILNEDQYALGYRLQADAGYATHYDGSDVTEQYKTETYGVHLYSFGSAFVTATLTRFYTWTGDFYFEPLYWELYNQHVKWERFEYNNEAHMWVGGDRMGRALQAAVTVYENMQTFETSLVDFLQDDTDLVPTLDDVAFDGDYETDYEDPQWAYDFEPDNLQDLLTDTYWGLTKLF
jgi:hypothetical protein